MKQEIVVPTIGESISSGVLTQWLKSSGDHVEEGQELFELETEKATMAVPATATGILETSVAPDTEVAIGQVVGTIDTESVAATAEAGSSPSSSGEPPVLSPAVRRLVGENDLDPSLIEGSGRGGRIVKADVQAYLEKPGQASPPPVSPKPPVSVAGQRQSRSTMSRLRRTIGQNLVSSKQSAAHLTTFNEVDMSEVMAMRSTYRDSFEKAHGVRLGFMSFFIKAAVRALQAYPNVNAFIDGDDIVENHYYNLGVAVSTERGLVVPVIRDADGKSFAAIEAEIVDLATRARDRKLALDEMTGGTFTITNGGVFGSLLSTPIPNPPQTAVLGMHTIQKRPVVRDDEIVIRPMMYLALTYDHRLIDGREAVSFLVRIKNLVEDPNQLLLEL